MSLIINRNLHATYAYFKEPLSGNETLIATIAKNNMGEFFLFQARNVSDKLFLKYKMALEAELEYRRIGGIYKELSYSKPKLTLKQEFEKVMSEGMMQGMDFSTDKWGMYTSYTTLFAWYGWWSCATKRGK